MSGINKLQYAFFIVKRIRCSKVQVAFKASKRQSGFTCEMLRAPLNQTAWKRATLSFQMILIYHVCWFCCCAFSILVYGSADTVAQCLLTLHNPEGCPVLCLKHSARFLFAGLRNGTVMVYGRNNKGEVLPRLLSLWTNGFSFVWEGSYLLLSEIPK